MEIKRYELLIDLLFRGLSIYRWNNFPRIESVTALDHAGFALHIAILLSYLVEERTGKTYDREAIIYRILFGIFFTTTHSDINHDVKESMKHLNPQIYNTLREKTYTDILTYPMHDIFRADFYKSMISGEDTDVENIVQYAKLYANLIEARTNARVYPEVYIRVLESISSRMQEGQFSLFREILPIDRESEIHIFLMTIRRLQSTYRWNMDRRTYPVSVMSHLIFVLFFTYILSLEYPDSIGDRTDAMITSIYHDVPEGITGDIITPTKEALPEIRPLLEEIEADKIDNELLTYIRLTSTHHTLRERILAPWKMPGGLVIKLADHYSALYEAKIEIPTHPEMQEVYDRIQEIIHLKQKTL